MARSHDLDPISSGDLTTNERDGGVLRLAICNPPANTLSIALMESLLVALETARHDDSIRVVILAARGKLFCAGHDLRELSLRRADPDRGKAFFEHTFARCSTLMQAIANFPVPVIAEVDGIATAAGCQLVASCDLAVASDRSRFGVNGIEVGLFCTTPAVALTRLISPRRASEMLMTGEMIDAKKAFEFGLVNRVTEAESLKEATNDLAKRIAQKSRLALRLGKQALNRQAGMDLAQAYEHASAVMVENLMSKDAEDGIQAFLEHRHASVRGSS